MIVIIEGTDLTGKTTLANQLLMDLQMPVVRPWMYLADAKPSVMSVAKTLFNLFQHVQPDVVYDRFFFSEYAYGAVLGREYLYVADLIRQWAVVPDIFVVLLTASHSILEERYGKRGGDWYVTLEQIVSVQYKYLDMIDVIPEAIPVLTIDTSEKSPVACASRVIEWLQEHGRLGFCRTGEKSSKLSWKLPGCQQGGQQCT